MKERKKNKSITLEMATAGLFIVSGAYLTVQALSTVVDREDRVVRAAPANRQDFTLMISPRPNPNLEADEVVKLVWSKLRSNNVPFENCGVRTLWDFTSPHFRSMEGKFSNFSAAMTSDERRMLLNNEEVRFGPLEVEGRTARQILLVPETDDGEPQVFMLILAKQAEGDYAECWLAEMLVCLPANPVSEAMFETPVLASVAKGNR